MADLTEDFSKLLTEMDIDLAMKSFNKQDYIGFLEEYKAQNQEIFDGLLETVRENESWQVEIGKACDNLAQAVRTLTQGIFFLSRRRYELNYVYVLVCYVFPAILEFRDEAPQMQEVCEMLKSSYEKVFPKDAGIGIATKEEIQSGFKTKIFGIPFGD